MAGSTPDAYWSSRAVRLLQPAAVACEGLRKRVRGQPLLDGVDLQVGVGARVLLVAEPDAAASLLLRILAGLTRPGGGTFRLAGAAGPGSGAERWGRRVAYVGRASGLHPWMSAAEALGLSARLLGLAPDVARDRIEEVVSRWRLADGFRRSMVRNGPAYLERAAMAAALIGAPEVVLLDEPMRAVDPDERVHLLRLPARRSTVLLASRYPAAEAGAVNEVVLLRDGRAALHAPTSALTDLGLGLTTAGIATLAEIAMGRRATSSSVAGQRRASA